ncbi:MAG: hypothetical protein CM15mP109_13960 [Candidatus Dadabacteria bacterium]|nr:MAG: hypothetical protein CM15mP109_13960 [Candidatus Dadabacteria bacterium]
MNPWSGGGTISSTLKNLRCTWDKLNLITPAAAIIIPSNSLFNTLFILVSIFPRIGTYSKSSLINFICSFLLKLPVPIVLL